MENQKLNEVFRNNKKAKYDLIRLKLKIDTASLVSKEFNYEKYR